MKYLQTVNQPENKHIIPILIIDTFHLFIIGCKIKLPLVKVMLMNDYLHF